MTATAAKSTARYRQPATDDSYLGGYVTVVRTLTDGRVTRERMRAFLAVCDVLESPQNGLTVRSARIEFGGELDRWGGSF